MSEPAAVRRLVATLQLLDSPVDGEVLAAAAAASRQIRALGMTWAELLGSGIPSALDPPPRPPPHWRDLVARCERYAGALTPWECAFLQGLKAYRTISPRQAECLHQIASRVATP